LESWLPLRKRQATVASLYNPSVREFKCDVERNVRLVDPRCVFGSQALLLSRKAVEFTVARWHTVRGMQDIRISRLAGKMGAPICYHAPSLVQHVGKKSTWGGGFHRALDFDADWRA